MSGANERAITPDHSMKVRRCRASAPPITWSLSDDAKNATIDANAAAVSCRRSFAGIPPRGARPAISAAGRIVPWTRDREAHGFSPRKRYSGAAKTRERRTAECESRGNQILYRANRASPVFEELAGILRKTSGMADEIGRALAALADHIRIAFVFGSMASGNQQQGSDIDLLIIGAVNFGSVVDVLHPVQKQLGREINPKVFSDTEWNAKIKSKSAFTTDVLGKPKVFLIGNEDELAGPGRKQSRSRQAKR